MSWVRARGRQLTSVGDGAGTKVSYLTARRTHAAGHQGTFGGTPVSGRTTELLMIYAKGAVPRLECHTDTTSSLFPRTR